MRKIFYFLLIVFFPLSIALAAGSFDALPQGDSATTDPALDDQPPAAPSITTETSTSSTRSSAAITSSVQSTKTGPELYWIPIVAIFILTGFFIARKRQKADL